MKNYILIAEEILDEYTCAYSVVDLESFARKLKEIAQDTAKEILTARLKCMQQLKSMFESPYGDYRDKKEHLVATIDIEIMGIKNLAKQHDVEVE